MICRPHGTYAVYHIKKGWVLLLLPPVRLAVTTLIGTTIPLFWWELLPAFLPIGYAVIKWATCRYRLSSTANDGFHTVTVEQGVLTRHILHISADDAASVEIECTPVLRLLGGRRIRINTAGLRRRADAVLYLPAATTKRLFASANPAVRQPRRRIWPIAVLALSGSNVAVGLLTAAPFLRRAGRLFGDRLPVEPLPSVTQLWLADVSVLLRFSANLFVWSWAFSVVAVFLRYVGFSAQREENVLRLSSGLLTRRNVLIDRNKITAVELRQTLSMRLFGLHTAVITAAGYGRDIGTRPVLVPAARPQETDTRLHTLLPHFITQTVAYRCIARGRYVWAPLACLTAAIVAGIHSGWWHHAAWFGAVGAAWWLIVRLLGASLASFGINDRTVTLSYPRGLALVQVFLPREAADCFTVTQSPFQRRRGLCTVHVRCFGEKRRRHQVRNLPHANIQALLAY